MPSTQSPSRRKAARRLLVLLIPLLLLSQVLLALYAMTRFNQHHWLVGVIPGVTVAMVLLVYAIWRRSPWARYVLLALICVEATTFSLSVLGNKSTSDYSPGEAYLTSGSGILTLIAVGVILSRSRRMRYLSSPAGGAPG